MKIWHWAASLVVAAGLSGAVAIAADAPAAAPPATRPALKEGGCCDKAVKAGGECKHPCCVAASEKHEVCTKCNAPAKGS